MPPASREQHEKLTVVATVSGMFRAQVLKSKLDSTGIPALLSYESAGLVFGLTADGLALSQVRVLVSAEHAERARQVLSVSAESDEEVMGLPDQETD